ncbi:MAG TPA: hypothetical protein PKE21_06355 [Flavobacteriales bacterium]|nr:hypothetical protein [Flavobacteriales bacterium]HMR27081.1 hypothetical protein [Flavobacteriales bacterium]
MRHPAILTMPPQRVATHDPALTPALLDMLTGLDERFATRIERLMEERKARRDRLASGMVERAEDTRHIRMADWSVEPLPANWMERRVEVIGPADRQRMIEGLHTGAKTYIADLSDLATGHKASVLRGHRALGRAARGRLSCISTEHGRIRLHASVTTRLAVAVRPLSALESMVRHGGRPVRAGLFDLVMLVHHHGRTLLERQRSIHVYLRDVQGHLEARLWNDLFDAVEEDLGLDRGSIRATVFVDTVSGALEAEETLFELAPHAGGLALDNAAYVADHIALFTSRESGVFPDRERFGMDCGLLESLARMVIGTCHRRGAHALGTPGHGLPHLGHGRAKPALLEMLHDKEHEAALGMDGTLMAHPGLVNAAMTEFNKHMGASHQLGVQRREAIAVSDLVRRPDGDISVDGLVRAVRTGLLGLSAMAVGISRIELDGRTHDRSSVRLALALLWQWVVADKGRVTASGLDIHDDLITFLVKKEVEKLAARPDAPTLSALRSAGDKLISVVLGPDHPEVV